MRKRETEGKRGCVRGNLSGGAVLRSLDLSVPYIRQYTEHLRSNTALKGVRLRMFVEDVNEKSY